MFFMLVFICQSYKLKYENIFNTRIKILNSLYNIRGLIRWYSYINYYMYTNLTCFPLLSLFRRFSLVVLKYLKSVIPTKKTNISNSLIYQYIAYVSTTTKDSNKLLGDLSTPPKSYFYYTVKLEKSNENYFRIFMYRYFILNLNYFNNYVRSFTFFVNSLNVYYYFTNLPVRKLIF